MNSRRTLASACFLALAAFSLLSLPSRSARATGVDHWDIARDPRAETDEKTYANAQSMLLQAAIAKESRDPSMARGAAIVAKDFATTARTLLDEIHAESHPDLRFRFLLADALHILDDDARTIAVLRPALDAAPDGPDVASALFNLAIAYARTGHPEEEVRCYDRCLLTAVGGLRPTVLNNRAESRAKIGRFCRFHRRLPRSDRAGTGGTR